MATTDITVVLGTLFGDEGKGKIVDQLAVDADIVCRFAGGNNAGHTVVVNDIPHYFHLLPSGILNKHVISLIGNGVVIHLPQMFEEIEQNKKRSSLMDGWEKRVLISNRAHLLFDFHQQLDLIMEAQRGDKSIGTTKRGIGPCYMTKVARNGIRVCDLVGEWALFEEKFVKN